MRVVSETGKDNSFGWDRVHELKTMTDLPLVIKGL